MALKTHLGFSIPGNENLAANAIAHFSGLGYRLADEKGSQWVFRRGNKLAAFWRFDIRAYDTTLKVLAVIEDTGSTWVSCDWEVWTFATITTGADIATLEAEGRELESVLKRAARRSG